MTAETFRRSPLHLVAFNILFALVVALSIIALCSIGGIVGYLLVEHGLVQAQTITSVPVILGGILVGAVLLTFPLSGALYLTFVRPIRSMAAAMDRLAAGDFSHRIDENLPLSSYEVRAFARSYNVAAEELAGTELMRNSFIGDFSHEFRTPITALNGFAQLLREDDLSPEERSDYLDVIVHESERLASLSERILTLSRLEAVTIVPDSQPVRIDEQIRRCVLMLQTKWETKDVAVNVDLDPCTVQGNEGYLAEVWLNVIDNAIKFSPSTSSVSVSLYGGRSSQDPLASQRPEAVVWVSDSGPGMDAETRRHLFEKFYQGDPSHAGEGNGLGLALCKRIIELHGGSIDVESHAKSGTVFEIRLPIARP